MKFFGVFLCTSVKCFLDVKVRFIDGHMDPSLREHQSCCFLNAWVFLLLIWQAWLFAFVNSAVHKYIFCSFITNTNDMALLMVFSGHIKSWEYKYYGYILLESNQIYIYAFNSSNLMVVFSASTTFKSRLAFMTTGLAINNIQQVTQITGCHSR